MRLLDLYCGAGGAGVGYARAGFEVVGVDIRPQPCYPFEFHLADALTFPLDGFDAIHASPPCQAHSVLASLEQTRSRLFAIHPDLVPATRARLVSAGIPAVMENVPGAPLRADALLCGSMFGLGARCRDDVWRQLRRHRIFECLGWTPAPTPACAHHAATVGVYGHGGGDPARQVRRRRGYMATLAEAREAMGIDWITSMHGLAEAIPPAYSEALGVQLARVV